MDINNLPKAFCILPWIHSAINPNGDVRPCCVSQPWAYTVGNLNKNTLEEIFNQEPLRELRKELLTAERLPDTCNSCRLREDADTKVWSYRQSSNEKYKDVVESLQPDPEGYAEFQQLYIDYRFSNKCNFKCISCGPPLSSSISQERLKIAQLKKPDVDPKLISKSWPESIVVEVDTDKFYNEFLKFSSTVREIYFAGGEPLINDHHYDLLEHFIETQQPINIFYNTNFSELNYKGKNVIEMWRKINGPVNIYASVDGFGDQGETIRNGFSTAKFESNVKKYIEAKLPHRGHNGGISEQHQIGFCLTFGLTNYNQVVDTAKWLATLVDSAMKEAGLHSDLHRAHDNRYYPIINFNPIVMPAAMSITFLNEQQRERAVTEITNSLNQLREDPSFKTVFGRDRRLQELEDMYLGYVKRVKLLESTDLTHLNEQIELLDEAETIRLTNWRQTLAPMYNFWTEIIENKGKK
jgi:radical SAM protein with 4Fe4S-binding SPASM domain